MTKRKLSPAAAYAIGIGSALAVGALSGLASMNGMKEFAELKQPPLSPPGWLFPAVWTILYTLMGISSARIRLSDDAGRKTALWLYGFQLVLNALWTPLFFELELRFAAFVLIILLLIVVIIMITRFFRIDRKAVYLQFPYPLWLLFAAYLNMGVYLLNR